MRVADTSALYALLSVRDTHHAEARRAFADPEPVLVPSEIWTETLALVQYRHGHAEAIRAGEALRRLPHLEIQPTPDDPFDDLQSAAAKIHQGEERLSLPDAIVVAWCRRRRLTPIAFDAALVDAAEHAG